MSRSDSVGLFWEDAPREKGEKRLRAMPEIPDTGWKARALFPDLSGESCISLDTETWDPELLDHGPGWARGKGHIVGVSLSVPGGFKTYYPLRHTIQPEDNLDPETVMRYLRDQLGRANQPKIGANLMYDLGWLRQEGVHVKGYCHDVQFAEAILNEAGRVNLENLAGKYLGESKETSLLYRWCADYYGGKPNGEQRANIYRSPPSLVGPYAEADADLPLRILPEQWRLLEAQGLTNVYDIECRLMPLLIAMRFEGVTVNLEAAEAARVALEQAEINTQIKLDTLVGEHVDVGSAASIARAFDHFGLRYGRTPTGAPSFRKEFLEAVDHDVAELIIDIRKFSKLRGTFIDSYIFGANVNGKIYCQFNPLRGDDGGTRSGRFSSSTPNLQNIPVRTEEGKRIRAIFRPDPGHKQWRKYDYSQIEYRCLAHYAVGAGSEEIRAKYNEDPETDYHEYVRQLIHSNAGILLDRRPTKNINFGLIYGMGKAKLIRSLGVGKKDGEHIFRLYHDTLPFALATMEATMNEANQNGFITTLLNRRSRFEMWESLEYDAGPALPYDAALMRYGRIQRAYLHKALNRRLQGSAADIIKVAMVKAWESGVFDYVGVPRLQVHDELDHSDPGDVDDGFAELTNIMESAIKLRIPVLVDCKVGTDWGNVE